MSKGIQGIQKTRGIMGRSGIIGVDLPPQWKKRAVESGFSFDTVAKITTGTGRREGGMAFSGDKLNIFGGYNGSLIPTNNTSVADISDLTSWGAGITGHPAVRRFSYGKIGNKIISAMGYSSTIASNCWEGNPDDSLNWASTPSINGAPVFSAPMIEWNGAVYVIGGYNNITTTYYNDVKRYNGTSWTTVRLNGSSGGYTPVAGASCVVDDDGNFYLLGGYNAGGYIGEVWKSTDQGVNWTQLTVSGTGFGIRAKGVAWFLDGYIYILGGYGADYLKTCFKSANGKDWEEVTINNVDWSARQDSMACVKDGKAYVYGGHDGATFFDELYRIG